MDLKEARAQAQSVFGDSIRWMGTNPDMRRTLLSFYIYTDCLVNDVSIEMMYTNPWKPGVPDYDNPKQWCAVAKISESRGYTRFDQISGPDCVKKSAELAYNFLVNRYKKQVTEINESLNLLLPGGD